MDVVQKYLDNNLKSSSLYNVTPQDKQDIKQLGLNQTLYNKFSSKKFRKWKIQPACEKRIKKAIETAILNKHELQVILPAGAYKLWRLPSFPEVDWAEFFNLSYVLKYLAPIWALYPKGVTFNYYLFTLLMQKSNNLSAEEVKLYIDSFQTLINLFLKFTPPNLKISIVKDVDFYAENEYFSILEKSLVNAATVFDQFPIERKEKYLKSSRLNIKGDADEEKIKLGALYEVAGNVDCFPKINEWVFDKDKIIIFPQSKTEFIGIGSTHSSITKYWTGFGVLEKNKDGFNDRILSPRQFEMVNKLTYDTVPTKIINLKNFSDIQVYNQLSPFV